MLFVFYAPMSAFWGLATCGEYPATPCRALLLSLLLFAFESAYQLFQQLSRNGVAVLTQ